MDQINLLVTGSVINAALKYAAAMTVCANRDAVLTDSIKDVLGFGGLEVIQTLLNDVVTIEILDKVDDLAGQRVDDHLRLVVC